MALRLGDGVERLPGIGPARARSLEKLGLATVEDLLRYFPRDYEDRRRFSTVAAAPVDTPVCLELLVAEPPHLSRIRKGLELVKARLVDDTGSVTATFFNQSYMKDALRTGETYVVYGRVEGPPGRRQMTNPVCERADRARFTGRILPIYPLTRGISNNLLAGLTLRCVEECAGQMEETLPAGLRREHALAAAEFACRNIHFPRDEEALELARRRLIFEELLALQLGLLLLRGREAAHTGAPMRPADLSPFWNALPFAPTGAQRRAAQEILADLGKKTPMNRLLQGDVGSGKTLVAAAGVYAAAQSGYQSVLMAPTEILAAQHADTLDRLLAPLGIRVALLTGSVKGAAKKAALRAIAAGEVELVVGTHAVLSAGVEFARLGFAVTDEQHRFGVRQRSLLAAKADHPHLLVMNATPIPRTLGLLMFGDLDISVLDELPPGRTPVKTYAITGKKRADMYGFVRRQLAAGRQAYIVCPVIDEGENDMQAVTTYYTDVAQPLLEHYRVGLMHGRLKAAEKAAVMDAFKAGALDVLVSTTVIEVGVDVPNANIIVIENAERYGLSALHQLRGRVGRGKGEAYCVLISDHATDAVKKRLSFLCHTNDGFEIAKFDLETRGPGDFFGSRQHGLPTLRIADLMADSRALYAAQKEALALVGADPALRSPGNAGLRRLAEELFSGDTALN